MHFSQSESSDFALTYKLIIRLPGSEKIRSNEPGRNWRKWLKPLILVAGKVKPQHVTLRKGIA